MRRAMTTVAMVLALGLLGAQGACGQQVDLTPLQNQIAEIQKQVQDLSSRVESMTVVGEEGGKKTVIQDGGVAARVETLEKKVKALEKQVNALSAKLDRVEKAVKSLAR